VKYARLLIIRRVSRLRYFLDGSTSADIDPGANEATIDSAVLANILNSLSILNKLEREDQLHLISCCLCTLDDRAVLIMIEQREPRI